MPATAVAKDSVPSSRPKNIVVIVLDDVGFSDIGAFGSEIRTPAIDSLAAGGLRFNRFDTKAVCSPTRAALLTGRNPQTVRMADLPAHVLDPTDLTRDRGELPSNARTIAQVLRASGYETHGFGKWRAVSIHRQGQAFDKDIWQLFDTEADFSESTDLAAQYPAKLEDLKRLWWRVARKYSTPALAEAPERFRMREAFDDSPDRPALPQPKTSAETEQ